MSSLSEFADAFLGIFQTHRVNQQPSVPIETLSLDDAYAVQQMVVERPMPH